MQEILNAIQSFWTDGILPILSFVWDGLNIIIKYLTDVKALIHPEFDFLRIIFGGMAPGMASLCIFVLGFCLATFVVRLVR